MYDFRGAVAVGGHQFRLQLTYANESGMLAGLARVMAENGGDLGQVHMIGPGEAMKLAAAHAIAGCVPRRELAPDRIVPSVFYRSVAQRVALAVRQAALKSGAVHREHTAPQPQPLGPVGL